MDWKSHIEVLLSAGATVEQLASGMGVTPNAVREIRAGRTRSPRADAAFKLADMKPDQFGESPLTHVTALFDTRMSKRALRAKLGMGSDRHLAALLQLPVEEVEAWPEEDALPALPQIKCLLGIEEKKESRAQDPDDGRIIRVEVA
ncbi:TPA: helix-turn-helix transcriptional regulator [Stenotrophomonas maltophilia]|nr:helix-turn-helix transcriptional regulator [Stenotrophomonas maltophilia]